MLRCMLEINSSVSDNLNRHHAAKVVTNYPQPWATAVSNLTTAISSLFSKHLEKGCGFSLRRSFDRVLLFVVVGFVGGVLQFVAGVFLNMFE